MTEDENKYNPFARAAVKNGIKTFKPHPLSKIKKTIAVISGKGGVGKSMVTSLLAVQLMKQGLKVGILDADVTGPSIAKTFGQDEYRPMGDENGIFPAKTEKGLLLIGANNLLDDPSTPVVWRGSLISNLVTTLYSQVIFDELDVLLIDMPPGTGDVPLTVFQSIPVEGAIVVSSPQDLVSMVVKKSITMASMMHINVLGVIENMAYITCPDCGKKIKIFGETPLDCLAAMMGANLIDELPMDGKLAALVDQGKLEDYEGDYLSKAVEAIKKL